MVQGTNLAADTCQAEGAMGLLAVKAIETVFETILVHVGKHFPYSGVRGLRHNIFLAGKGFSILLYCRKIVGEIIIMMMPVVMIVVVRVMRVMCVAHGRCSFLVTVFKC